MEHDEEELERKHFCRIVNAFKAYGNLMLKRLDEKKKFIKTMPDRYQDILDKYVDHIEQQKVAIMHNSEIIKLIIRDVENMFENVQHEITDTTSLLVPTSDLEKVQSTLKQITRDWSKEGEHEREACYGPIIKKVEQLFPRQKWDASQVQILVPGAGLGRLAYELAKRGYTCQGNEYSLFMLFASNFVLNKTKGVDSLKIYPWVHSGCNMMNNEDQMNMISFPDCDPSDIPPSSSFTMAAGDFLDVYTEDNTWDCIATSFFIDCANNVVAFVDAIYKILKPGGYWVNLGPLLYHFSDQPGEPSIEPSYELVKKIITDIGFIFKEEKTAVRTTYTQQRNSMLSYEYSSVFFVVQKPNIDKVSD